MGMFAFPAPVKATGAPVFDAANFGEMVKDGFVEVLTASALGALLNGASYFMRKIAYDTASYLANGGKGQSALVFKKGWGSYLEDVGGNAAATAVDQLGKPFGLDLCKMPNVSFQVDLQIGLRSLYGLPGVGAGPTPNCSFQQLKDGWKDFDNMEKLKDGALNAFNASLTVSQSDFGIALNAIGQVDRLVAKERFQKVAERTEGGGFKAVTDLVSGNVKTPASVVAEESKALSGPEQTKLTMGQIAGVYGSGALQIIPMAGSVFLNTLISQGLNNLFTKGLVPDDKGKSAVVDFYAQSILNNKKAAEKAFNYLFTAVPKKQLEAYDALSELEACSDNPGLNNCVIDSKFREAIYRARLGKPITIRDALKEKLLEGNKPLISPLRAEDNTNINCRTLGYCYSNLQKLRKLRVVPLGFELAALRSDPDQPWTLQDVVDGFEDCTYLNNDPTTGQVVYDAKKPFCHLIDPNWILRLPEARCESKVYGPILLSPSTADRREECADISTCITEGPNGECVNEQTYAYCTKEKNIWSLPNSCSPQYNTCKSFVDTNNTVRSYLSRTVDYGSCGAQSVGCAAYSLEKNNGAWVTTPQVSITKKRAGQTQMAFFNKTIANSSCPSDAEGCSMFYAVEKITSTTYKKMDTPEVKLKKAPDFLGCYDIDPNTIGVQYPKNSADLLKISQSDECKKFAAACLPQETACQSYTPVAGEGPAIPGIIGANGCAAQCVGYDTFKQEPTQFDQATYPLYIVPSEGKSCDAQYAGCTEFTNLSGAGSGGENLEYYTAIKYCEKPTGTNIKTFYSWEGDSEKGYVLTVHKLRPFSAADVDYIGQIKGSSTSTAEFTEGTPAYADDSFVQLDKNGKSCNETLYNAYINGLPGQEGFDPDCRGFYDEEGKASFRLLGQTISVSESCSELRKTESEFYVSAITNATICAARGGKMEGNTCMRCSGGGVYKNGSCVYSALVGEAGTVSCSAAVNGCREYTGNTGNNTLPVATSDFEGQNAATGWSVENGSSVTLAAESIQVGLHSLQVNGTNLDWTFPSSTDPIEDGWYEASFWVRGTPQSLTVTFLPNTNPAVSLTENAQTKQSNPVSVNNNWRLHRLGPVYLSKGAVKSGLRFSGATSEVYFIDSVELRKVTSDNLFLIKDSWKKSVQMPDGTTVVSTVPLACDANPLDTFPGAALGCRAYKDANNKDAFATGFEQLCREEAIGCQALVDTFNTVKGADAEKAHVYHAICSVASDVSVVTACSVTIGSKAHTCNIQIGEKTCSLEDFAVSTAELAAIPDANITASTIIIPADTPINEPIFLTNRKEFRCSPEMLGCMKVAKQNQTLPTVNSSSFAFQNELFVKNNPENYTGPSSVLCDTTQVGCSEFGSDNTKSYFKDPLLSGNTLCEYQEKVTQNGNTYSGWFKSGVGHCADNPANLCRPDSANADCGTGIACTAVGEVECYSNYLDQGGQYGIWSNKSNNYNGFVGVCPDDQNQCTELVDPQDKSVTNPNGKPYYVIFDDQITDRAAKCAGGASLDEGCVMFDKTEDPNKKYSSLLSYAESKKNGNKLTPPKSGTQQYPGDSNVILSVDRDRQCSEWLSCSNSMVITDKESGVPQRVCYDYRACVKNKNGQCISWKQNTEDDAYLSEEEYVGRDTSWYSEEFVGYSLLNKYQVHYYSYITVSSTAYAVYRMDESDFEAFPAASCLNTDAAKTPKEDWTQCGFAGENGKGRCYQGSCIYPITGGFPVNMVANKDNFSQALAALGTERFQCKAYPEETSPFSSEIGKNSKTTVPGVKNLTRKIFDKKSKGYDEANICQEGKCSCSYVKIEYKGVAAADYWNKKGDTTIQSYGICEGGDNDGQVCDKESYCGTGGSCAKISKIETHDGLMSICLEEDQSRIVNGGERACLTWLPIDVGLTGVDNYNNDPSAGYNPNVDSVNGGELYCTASFGAYKSYDSGMFIPSSEISTMVDTLGLGLADSQKVKKSLEQGPFGAPENSWYDYADWDQISLGPLNEDYHTKCLIKGECGGDKKYSFQQIVYSTMLRQAWQGTQIKSPNTSVVWFVDDTFTWLTYAQNSFDTFGESMRGIESDGSICQVKGGVDCSPPLSCSDSIRADGSSLVWPLFDWSCSSGKEVNEPWRDRSGMKYFRPLKDIPISETETPYLSKGSESTYESTVQQIYFSPIILPFVFDVGGYNYAAPYSHFNEVYLDFNSINNAAKDEVIVIPMAKARTAVKLGEKDLTNTTYLMFEKKGEIKKGDETITRYALILSLSSKISEEKATALLDSYLSEIDPSKVKSPDDFPYVIIYADFDTNGKIILQGGNGTPKKPFYASFEGEIPTNYPGSNINDHSGYKNSAMAYNLVVASTVVYWPFCSAFEQVYNSKADLGAGDGTDKAWTNRVWSSVSSVDKYQLPEKTLLAKTVYAPYATTNLGENDLIQSKLAQYTFTDFTKDGRPLTCEDPVVQGLSRLDFFNSGIVGIGCNISSGKGYSDLAQSLNYTDYLFAKEFSKFTLQQNNSAYVDLVGVGKDNDISYASKKGNITPQVYSLNPATCFVKSSGATVCTAGEANNITINQKNAMQKDYNGDGLYDEDPGKKGFHEAQIGVGGTFLANAKFFAFADDNQMPIKRVMINWDDNTPVVNADRYGKYKNHKPYCATSDTGYVGLCGKLQTPNQSVPTQLTCNTDSECSIVDPSYVCLTKDNKEDPAKKLPGKLPDQDAFDVPRFGNSPRACEPTYFEFDHVYTCVKGGQNAVKLSAAPITAATKARLYALNVKDNDDVCVFKPGVQIRDNWDWCNGIVASGYFKDACDQDTVMDRYTQYKGNIIVIPE